MRLQACAPSECRSFPTSACRLLPQFWSVYVPCGAQGLDAVQIALEQLDTLSRMVTRYPDLTALARTADGENIQLSGIRGSVMVSCRYTAISLTNGSPQGM